MNINDIICKLLDKYSGGYMDVEDIVKGTIKLMIYILYVSFFTYGGYIVFTGETVYRDNIYITPAAVFIVTIVAIVFYIVLRILQVVDKQYNKIKYVKIIECKKDRPYFYSSKHIDEQSINKIKKKEP